MTDRDTLIRLTDEVERLRQLYIREPLGTRQEAEAFEAWQDARRRLREAKGK